MSQLCQLGVTFQFHLFCFACANTSLPWSSVGKQLRKGILRGTKSQLFVKINNWFYYSSPYFKKDKKYLYNIKLLIKLCNTGRGVCKIHIPNNFFTHFTSSLNNKNGKIFPLRWIFNHLFRLSLVSCHNTRIWLQEYVIVVRAKHQAEDGKLTL